MTGKELLALFEKGSKRYTLIGNLENGVVAGLDLEGRLFTIFNNEVVNLVNPEAILEVTDRSKYLNPGGDGLWPAPEGTCLGYEYATGNWRVPPALTGARFKVISETKNRSLIEAEVDLINASGLGIPTIFSRDVEVICEASELTVKVTESIKYIGTKIFTNEECLLTPWTLCQFNSNAGCEVIFPEVEPAQIWDMYEDSSSHRFLNKGFWHVQTDSTLRFQVGIGERVPWIKLIMPDRNLSVTRNAKLLDEDQGYIDIIDAPPTEKPSNKGVCYSVYSDTGGFMEIEAAGGCPKKITPNSTMSVEVMTKYS